MVKLHFKRGKHDLMMSAYKQMLTYIKSAVTRNYSEKVINKILDLVSNTGGAADKAGASSSSASSSIEFFQSFYETTLAALQEAKNDRLWFKTNLKLGKLWFDREEFTRLQRILKELHVSCQDADGADDPTKGTQLLEVHARAEIHMHPEISLHLPVTEHLPCIPPISRFMPSRSRCTPPQRTTKSSSRSTPRRCRSSPQSPAISRTPSLSCSATENLPQPPATSRSLLQPPRDLPQPPATSRNLP